MQLRVEPDGLAFPGACVLVLCGKGGMNSKWGWDGRAWCPNPAPQGHRPQGKRSVQAECRSVRPGAGVVQWFSVVQRKSEEWKEGTRGRGAQSKLRVSIEAKKATSLLVIKGEKERKPCWTFLSIQRTAPRPAAGVRAVKHGQ